MRMRAPPAGATMNSRERCWRPTMEHRWGHRIAVDLPVRLVLSPGVVIWGRIRDISMTGAFVHSMQPLAPGALVSIEPTSAIDHRLPSALDATVVWTRDGGAGLEWCDPR